MDYKQKLDKIDKHLAEHPKDYQAVIAKMMLYSKAVDDYRRKQTVERLKNVSKYRRQLNEKHKQK